MGLNILRFVTKRSNIKLVGIICFLIYFYKNNVEAKKLVTERAVVKYWNRKYFSNIQVFTMRRRRSDPYTTNITATTLHTWGNNITFSFSYDLPNTNNIGLSIRLCDILAKQWMVDVVKLYSNITKCPEPAGTYSYFNVEIPPKNFPMPLPPSLKKGDTGKVNFQLYKTKDMERVLEIYCIARII